VAERVAWVDASSGASGDMLLGALAGAGVPVGVMVEAVDKVAPGQIGMEIGEVDRAGFVATRCHVEIDDTVERRTWREAEALLNEAGLHEEVRSLAHDVFSRLAEAEGRVHGHPPEEVHFHEVGALDAIADVVGVCAGFVHLGVQRVVVSEVSVGGGTVSSEHGRLPVPPPAVVELLRGVPSSGGPVDLELCTPTGAALLATLADDWGSQPTMSVRQVGIGAGARDPDSHANVLRLLVGEAHSSTTDDASTAVLLEANVDDLDPRLWPGVLTALLEAGASDAWLTPILMKKGRPAHTLSVLVSSERATGVRREVYRHTSTIGLREQRVGKHELDREMATVEVDGHVIGVKVARLDGEVVNVQPEFEDVAAAARALGLPVKTLMARATAEGMTQAVTGARGPA
jgi:pyridinium-3,5-bisthiocarboxylic acid mononucleotide nickel chelatase